MKETKNENRIKGQLKGRIIAGLVLLVVSVALLAVLIPTGVTYAKYIREIYDYTGAVAGDFHFSSNYLEEVVDGQTKTYTINDWNGGDFTFDFEIYNFDNSLRYNEEGLDCYYYLETNLYYEDEENSSLNEKSANEYTLTYIAKTEKITGTDDKGNDVTEEVDLMEGAYTYLVPVEYETKTDENGNESTTTTVTKWKVYPVIKLPATSGRFNRETGTQQITVQLGFKGVGQTAEHVVEIKAKSIPTSELKNIRAISYNTAKTEKTYENLDNAEKIPETNYDGIYGASLVCKVILKEELSSQSVSAKYRRVDDNSNELNYSLSGSSGASSATSKVRVFFNSKRVTADQNLLTNGRSEFPQATVTTDGSTVEMKDDNCDVRYFDTTVQSSSVRDIKFYTDWYAKDDGTYTLKIPGELLDGKKCSYDRSEWEKNDGTVPDIWFEILDEDAETENYTYTLTIKVGDQTTLSVWKADTELHSGDSINKNDTLKVIYTGGKVTVNGGSEYNESPIYSEGTFRVGAENITVESEKTDAYLLTIDETATPVTVIRNGVELESNAHVYEGDRLTITAYRGTATVSGAENIGKNVYIVGTGEVKVGSIAATVYNLKIEQEENTNVTVTRDGEELESEANVYEGDKLIITVTGGYVKITETDHTSKETIRVINHISGETYTVTAADITITSTVDSPEEEDEDLTEDDEEETENQDEP